MKRFVAYCMLFSLTLPSACFGVAAQSASLSDRKSQIQMSSTDVAAIGGVIDSIAKSLAAGDVDSLVELWTPDGSYTDHNGDVFQGADSLKKRFSSVLANHNKVSVSFKSDAVRSLSGSAAVAEGTVLRKDEKNESVPDTRYTIVLTKNAGKWKIVSASETDIAPPEASEPSPASLQDLTWLIGDWKAERNGNSLRLHVDRVGNEKFVRLNYQISRPGQPLEDDTEIVGIDPISQELVSWSFDSNGAVGQSTWRKDSKQWNIDCAKTAADGSSLTSRNIIKADGNDRFTWQSINRTAAGLPLSDTGELTIERAAH